MKDLGKKIEIMLSLYIVIVLVGLFALIAPFSNAERIIVFASLFMVYFMYVIIPMLKKAPPLILKNRCEENQNHYELKEEMYVAGKDKGPKWKKYVEYREI